MRSSCITQSGCATSTPGGHGSRGMGRGRGKRGGRGRGLVLDAQARSSQSACRTWAAPQLLHLGFHAHPISDEQAQNGTRRRRMHCRRCCRRWRSAGRGGRHRLGVMVAHIALQLEAGQGVSLLQPAARHRAVLQAYQHGGWSGERQRRRRLAAGGLRGRLRDSLRSCGCACKWKRVKRAAQAAQAFAGDVPQQPPAPTRLRRRAEGG